MDHGTLTEFGTLVPVTVNESGLQASKGSICSFLLRETPARILAHTGPQLADGIRNFSPSAYCKEVYSALAALPSLVAEAVHGLTEFASENSIRMGSLE